jgi:hypothetical protein
MSMRELARKSASEKNRARDLYEITALVERLSLPDDPPVFEGSCRLCARLLSFGVLSCGLVLTGIVSTDRLVHVPQSEH